MAKGSTSVWVTSSVKVAATVTLTLSVTSTVIGYLPELARSVVRVIKPARSIDMPAGAPTSEYASVSASLASTCRLSELFSAMTLADGP